MTAQAHCWLVLGAGHAGKFAIQNAYSVTIGVIAAKAFCALPTIATEAVGRARITVSAD